MNLGRGGSARSDINVTPLIDVVLVLLIIFLVTMPITMRTTPLEVPPTVVDAPPPPSPPIVVTLNADLSVTIRRGATEVEVPGTALAATLRPLLDGADPVVFVAFEDPVPWGETVAVMDSVRGLAADVDHNGIQIALALKAAPR